MIRGFWSHLLNAQHPFYILRRNIFISNLAHFLATDILRTVSWWKYWFHHYLFVLSIDDRRLILSLTSLSCNIAITFVNMPLRFTIFIGYNWTINIFPSKVAVQNWIDGSCRKRQGLNGGKFIINLRFWYRSILTYNLLESPKKFMKTRRCRT